MQHPDRFDVIVIGGGHAGTEACLASARMGCKTLLLTHNIETLGQMSCNPAIGGIGKSHLVKEIDALGGAMAAATDLGGIQFRVLNSRKGPAVRATRAQADRVRYKAAIRNILENQPNLSIFQQSVDDLIVEGDRVKGVITQMGLVFNAKTVVVTAGTFLAGKVHIGLENHSAGRAGDPPAEALAKRLRELPFRVERLKTGTPPRIDARTVDFSNLQEQWGDQPEPVMSYLGSVEDHPQQTCCWITYTNANTHNIIRGGMDRSPMYTGVIDGVGPRYCPSIEDKINRFSEKERHQLFVEPEGWNTVEVYVNGFSTSLPEDVQFKALSAVKGFENVKFFRPGYAIEYDYFPPTQLTHSLETKPVKGLYFAGQINGTTGYEEAASQGLMAGINASLKVQEKDPFVLKRNEAYIGVLIDDLITKGTEEPYRMFTSRAEYRTLLRQDNADIRLTPKGYELGIASEKRLKRMEEKLSKAEAFVGFFRTQSVKPEEANPVLESKGSQPIRQSDKMFKIFSRPNIGIEDVRKFEAVETYIQSNNLDNEAIEQAEIQVKYSGYITKEKNNADKLTRLEYVKIPSGFDYSQIKSMSYEAREKLKKIQPTTVAQASRISGISPSDITVLLVYLGR